MDKFRKARRDIERRKEKLKKAKRGVNKAALSFAFEDDDDDDDSDSEDSAVGSCLFIFFLF